MAIRVTGIAAAAVGVAGVIFNPWNQGPADADTPPVLEYEFANARNIAYAPGEGAASSLLDLARAARVQSLAPTEGPTQFVVTENWFVDLEDSKEALLIPKQRESWLRSDGSRRVREVPGRPLAPDGRGLEVNTRSNPTEVADETYPPDGLDAQFVDRLGGNTKNVRIALLNEAHCEDSEVGASRASCLYQEIVGLYDRYVIPPSTAAAFWRILAAEPTMRSLGQVRDRAGREGVGISYIPADAPEFRRVLIISSKTGQLLGTEDILIKSDPHASVKAPAIYGFSAILSAQFTNEPGPP